MTDAYRSPVIVSNLADLGDAVRRRREAAGLTLDEAADLLGVGRRFLIELEHGKRRANVETVIRVLRALGVDLVLVPRGGAAGAGGVEPAP